MKALGALAPLSTAAQPASVNQIGFDCGTHAVGVAASRPPGRNTQGLPWAPSMIGVRIWRRRSSAFR